MLAGTENRPGASSTSPPILWKNVIVSGAADPNGDGRVGDVRGFDVITGKQLWRFATVPEKGQEEVLRHMGRRAAPMRAMACTCGA